MRVRARSTMKASHCLIVLGMAAMALTTLVSASEVPKPSPTLAKIVQVALTVRDLPAAIKFYKEGLGLTLLFETNGMAFFDAGGVRLLVGVVRGASATPGTSVVYFDAADWKATEAGLTARGIKFDSPIEVIQRAGEKELVLHQFKDPDGNLLAILGWRAKQ